MERMPLRSQFARGKRLIQVTSMATSGKRIERRRPMRKNRAFPYLMTLPYYVIYAVFGLFPIIYTFYLSFFDWNGVGEKVFSGISNYARLFSDTLFWKTILNTLILAGLTLPVQMFMGFSLAAALSSKHMVLKKTFRFVNFLPYITNSVAIGMIFSVLFTWRGGMINEILSALGLISKDIYWTGQPWPARFMVALMLLWKNTGYTSLFFAAGITNINPNLYEAAEIDGANQLQRHLHITLPLTKNVMRFVVLTTTIGLLQLFDELFNLFSGTASNAVTLVGGPKNAVLTTVWYMYDKGFGSVVEMGYASSIAYGLFIIILAFTFLINRSLEGRRRL